MNQQTAAKITETLPIKQVNAPARKRPPGSVFVSDPQHALVALQDAVGNRAVGQLLGVNQPGASESNPAHAIPEHPERQRNATATVGMLQRKCACGGALGSTPECQACRKTREAASQRAAISPAPANVAPPIVHEVLRSRGQPLDAATRAYMELRFGREFSGVSVHTDAKAAASAQAVNALAYTVGQNMVFNTGQYAPGTAAGQQLLAHELTHTLQQSQQAAMRSPGAPPDAGTRAYMVSHFGRNYSGVSVHTDSKKAESVLPIDEHDSASECEADRIGEEVMTPTTRRPSSVAHRTSPQLSLQHAAHTGAAARGSASAPQTIYELPAIFVAEPLPLPGGRQPAARDAEVSVALGGYSVAGGLSLHVLASGDMGWLPRSAAAQRVLSPEYWSPLMPSRGTITLDRLLDQLPRDLAPRIESELASGQPLSWVRGVGATGTTFTEAELRRIPALARRFNAGQLLSEAEISLLARVTELHVGGRTPGAPVASYTLPNFDLPLDQNYDYRVRVEIPRGNVLDVSQPNAITNQWLNNLPNVEEMEFMAVANHEGRIVSVQRIAGSSRPSPLMSYSGAIRWGGRILVVAGPALSAYHVAAAPEGERAHVAAEELGGMAGGAVGEALAVAGCVGFGIASGGVGLLICGLFGGVIGTEVGSAIGGDLQTESRRLQAGSTPCPSCHALQREWEARRSFSRLSDVDLGQTGTRLGEQLSVDGRAPGTRALTPDEIRLIRQWLESSRQPQ